MSRAFLIIGISLALAGSVRAADVEFVRVWPGWRDGPSFKRISEYFTGVENTGGQIVRRTDPQSREGYYFLVRVKTTGAAWGGAKFVLRVITPAGPDPQVFPFAADVPAGGALFDLGLTGADWAGKSTRPVAWKLELFAADGRLLSAQQSFLWAMPAK
jgi:hypothetical protein